MKKPVNSLIVMTVTPLTAYAIFDIAANLRGLEDKFVNFLSGYSIIANYFYDVFPKLTELPQWAMTYFSLGIVFKFSLIIVKILHPYEKQKSWFDVYVTTVRHVFAWPIILLNFLLIGLAARNRGDFNKSEEELGSKNYNAYAYLKSLYQYIGCTLFMSAVALVAIGAW